MACRIRDMRTKTTVVVEGRFSEREGDLDMDAGGSAARDVGGSEEGMRGRGGEDGGGGWGFDAVVSGAGQSGSGEGEAGASGGRSGRKQVRATAGAIGNRLALWSQAGGACAGVHTIL